MSFSAKSIKKEFYTLKKRISDRIYRKYRS